MRISPLDIRKQSFKKSMRGVDAEEVRIFLELVASEYEKVLQDNAMMAEKLRYQDERLHEYRELEKSMRNSLVTADRIASESRESSEREAGRLVQDAHLRADRILQDARERLQILIGEIEALKSKKEVYARRFWALVESQLSVLQEHMQDEGEVDSLRRRVEHLVSEPESPQTTAARAANSPSPTGSPDSTQSAGGGERGAGQRPSGGQRPAGGRPDGGRSDARSGDPRSGSFEPNWAELAPTHEDAREDSGKDEAYSPYAPAPRSSAYAPLPRDPAEREEEEDEIPRERRGLPRGLSRLLRGRQANLPLERPAGSGFSGNPADDRDGFSPVRERREGFIEIRAGEGREDGNA